MSEERQAGCLRSRRSRARGGRDVRCRNRERGIGGFQKYIQAALRQLDPQVRDFGKDDLSRLPARPFV